MRAPRSPFIPLGAAFIVLSVASAVFAGVWLYLWLHAVHPLVYWVVFAMLVMAVVGLWWLLTYSAKRSLDDANSLRSEFAETKEHAAAAEEETYRWKVEYEKKKLEYSNLKEKYKELLARKDVAPSGDVLPVELAPTVGKSDKMFLKVTNKGPEQQFYAQCDILENPGSPKLQTVFDLGWEGSLSIKHLFLSREQVGKLLIAAAGEDRVHNFSWMTLRALGGENVELERWERGESNTQLIGSVSPCSAPLQKPQNLRSLY